MRIIGATISMVALVGIFAFLKMSNRTAHASGVEYLQTSLVRELAGYYEDHKIYPKTLGDIPINHIVFGPGATLQMLHDFSYISDGTNFTLYITQGFGRTNRGEAGRLIQEYSFPTR